MTVSLLFGLPRVRDHHIRSILEFERRHFLALTLRGGEKALLACFFRLSPFIGVHRRQEEFGVVPGEPYHVNDLQGVDGLPEIRTRYLRFLSWDEDQRGYLTRAQVLAKHQVGALPLHPVRHHLQMARFARDRRRDALLLRPALTAC